MTVYGVDVSHHQGDINWPAVYADGIRFAILKATEGLSYDWQTWYSAELREATSAGLLVGSYLFMHDQDGGAQADYFVAREKAYGAATHAQELDVETAPGPDYPTAAQTDAAASRIDALLGLPVGCYTARWYWSGILGNPPMPASVAYVWEARYVYNGVLRPWRDCADEVPAAWWTEARCGGRQPAVLQINSNAVVDGISGGADLDVYPGTLDELRALMLGTQEEDDMSQADAEAAIRTIFHLADGETFDLIGGQTTNRGAFANIRSAVGATYNNVNEVKGAVAQNEARDAARDAALAAALDALQVDGEQVDLDALKQDMIDAAEQGAAAALARIQVSMAPDTPPASTVAEAEDV